MDQETTLTPDQHALAHALAMAEMHEKATAALQEKNPETRKFKEGDDVKITHGDWGNNHAKVIDDEAEGGEVKCVVQCQEVFIHRDQLMLA